MLFNSDRDDFCIPSWSALSICARPPRGRGKDGKLERRSRSAGASKTLFGNDVSGLCRSSDGRAGRPPSPSAKWRGASTGGITTF
jgi:hypothetical protein